MASRRRPYPKQTHAPVGVHPLERDAPQPRREPVEAPPVARGLVDEHVVDAGVHQGAPDRPGTRLVEAGLAQADSVVGDHLGLRVVVREGIDAHHGAVRRAGEPVEALDRRIGGYSPGQVRALGLGAADHVQWRLPQDVGQGALAVGLVQRDERRQRQHERHYHDRSQDRRRRREPLAGELHGALESRGGHDRQRSEYRHEEAHLQRGKRRRPERQVAQAEEGGQRERARWTAPEGERHQDQVDDAEAAAEGSAVHGHVPRQGEDGSEAVAVAELVVEGVLGGVGLGGPNVGVRAEHVVGRREDRVAGLGLRSQVPRQGREQRKPEEPAGRDQAPARTATGGDQDKQGEWRGGDQGERLGRERQPAEEAGERERARGGLLRVADQPAEREHHEERGGELDVARSRFPRDRGRHGEDGRREQRRAARGDLRAEPVRRERQQHAEAEVDQLGRDLVADRKPVGEQQLRGAWVVRDVLAAEVDDRSGVQVALGQVEVVPERVVLDLRRERGDQREHAHGRQQAECRPLQSAPREARPRKPSRSVHRCQRHAQPGQGNQRARLEQPEWGEPQSQQVDHAEAHADRGQEALQLTARPGQHAAQQGAVSPGCQEDRRGRGEAPQSAQRLARDRQVRQRSVHHRPHAVAGGGSEVRHRHGDRPRAGERCQDGAAAFVAVAAIHALVPLSSHPRQRSNE